MSGRDHRERQQNALLEIGRRWRTFEADLDKAVAAIVETATVALDAGRASVWFFDTTGDAIVCHDLYESSLRRHSRGTVLHRSDNPAYFEAMQSEEVIVAEDARSDQRTALFDRVYLAPVGIGAMLDAPIRVGGHTVGVLCIEHLGSTRRFSVAQQNAATYLASLVSLAFEYRRLEQSEHAREETLSLLRAAFEAMDAGILALGRDGAVITYNRRFIDLWDMPDALLGPGSSRKARVAFVVSQTTEPDRLTRRLAEITANPETESLDVFDLNDGRAIECATRPQRLDGQVIGRVWAFRDVTSQRRMERRLRELAVRDPLTGLGNRRNAEESLDRETHRARRSGQPLCVAMLDIDRFKRINDVHGHQTGDEVLRQLAADLRERLRGSDTACRWGGEEFLLILPDTELSGAVRLVDELRLHTARDRGDLPAFTISAGVARYGGEPDWETVVCAADARLYEAKNDGRNRVAH